MSKFPPHSIESEQSVLGGLLLDNNALDKIADLVTEADFYRHDHRLIYRHISKLIEHGKPADVITVAESLESGAMLNEIGGLAYLGGLAQNTPSSANIRRYAEIVQKRAVLRALCEVADGLKDACLDSSDTDPEKIAQRAESAISDAVDRQSGEPSNVWDAFGEALQYIDSRDECGGLITGLRDFDGITGGLEPGQLIIIAARPSVGKSALAINMADHVASNGGSALIFSLEMPRREVAMRLLAARTGVSVHTMRSGKKAQANWESLSYATSRANKLRLYIDDRAAIGLGYIRAKARRIKRQFGLNLIVIDYLQLMTGAGSNRTQEIGSISRGLKALAKDLDVPIIALAQLNRSVEGRNDKRPMMSDLRDSGEIEQDADIVAMLHRESLYSDSPEWQGVAELIVRKNRNGPTGDLILNWLPNDSRFTDRNGQNPRLNTKIRRDSSQSRVLE